mgnify:CR=1 FL=1
MGVFLVSVFVFIASCGDRSGQSESTSNATAPEITSSNTSNLTGDESEPLQLTFGVYASDEPKDMVEQFRPVLDAIQVAMSELLQQPVEIKTQVLSTYEEGISSLTEGMVDFARFGPASYTIAKEMNPALILVGVEQVKGGRTFYGVICVHEDSDIQSCQDLTGRSFAFGDDKSTIGRYLSQEYLVDCGINASALAKYDYLQRHDRVGDAVARQEYDAGALKESTFQKMVAGGSSLREVGRFPNVTKPWAAKSDLDPEVEAALRRALLEMDDEAALKALKKSGFEAGNDSDYDPIRKAISRNDIFFQ